LLQEAPPPWAPRLAARCAAHAHRSLTARNQARCLTWRVGVRRPDLLGSWEGGSNVTLVRGGWQIVERRGLLLSGLRERALSERRRMTFLRLVHDSGSDPTARFEVCVANLHATQRSHEAAEAQLLRAATAATRWAGPRPLVLAGDFNLRPHASAVFDRLGSQLGLAAPTAPDAIDHILVRGLETVSLPRRWPAERRDVQVAWSGGRRRIRLSDHAPVQAVFRMPSRRSARAG
jgi:endonuclease/exonuclease/phosphatase family metal-dependent hydrolase